MNGSNVAAAALNYRILCPTAPYSPSLPIGDLNKPDVESHSCSQPTGILGLGSGFQLQPPLCTGAGGGTGFRAGQRGSLEL